MSGFLSIARAHITQIEPRVKKSVNLPGDTMIIGNMEKARKNAPAAARMKSVK